MVNIALINYEMCTKSIICCTLLGTYNVEETKGKETSVFGNYNHMFEIYFHVFETDYDYLRLTFLKLDQKPSKLFKDLF